LGVSNISRSIVLLDGLLKQESGGCMNFKDALRTFKFHKKTLNYHQLYTKWGEELDPNHVLEEYPRPQLKRDNYTILNGYWNYAITKEAKRPDSFDGEILVPFSPESVLSGVNRQLQPDEYLWYERELKIQPESTDRRCFLHFGAVDQYCEVQINHITVTKHLGGYLPFSVEITDELQEGVNILTVLVRDISDTSYHSRGKQLLKRGGMWYTAQSGIWQTVWLEWVPQQYIENIKITPDIDKSQVHIELVMGKNELEKASKDNTTDELYKVEVYDGEVLKETIISKYPDITIPMKTYRLWSPENPSLYNMVITTNEDRVESYFAMRSIEIKKDSNGISRICLNHNPYFQNGLLDQGYWPDGLYTAPSDDALIYDIIKAKELGFNMLRKHIKIEPLRWYYHCDRLGMLVWQDMVNGGSEYNMVTVGYLPTLFPNLARHRKDKQYKKLAREDEDGRKEWTEECIKTVELLFNSPSICVWVPFNEGWGQFDTIKAYKLIKEMDSTRLIDHASGWFDQNEGDFKSIHNYFHNLKVEKDERPVVFSEFGGYACYINEHSYSWQIYGYRIYPTKELFDDAFQRLYKNEISKLIKEGLSACVYTQLSDIEDEVNGLLTYDRKVCKVEALKKDLFKTP